MLEATAEIDTNITRQCQQHIAYYIHFLFILTYTGCFPALSWRVRRCVSFSSVVVFHVICQKTFFAKAFATSLMIALELVMVRLDHKSFQRHSCWVKVRKALNLYVNYEKIWFSSHYWLKFKTLYSDLGVGQYNIEE